jgi:hypothetical protein
VADETRTVIELGGGHEMAHAVGTAASPGRTYVRPGRQAHGHAPCDNPTCWESLSSARAARYDAMRNHLCEHGHHCSTACYDEATGQVR